MKELFNIDGRPLDLSKLCLLSEKGSECIVYKYNSKVVKLFREDYMLPHLNTEDILYLKNIPTKMGHVLDEMKVLQDDLKLLNQFKIGLRDINPSNVIYNGQVYIIDPGNYIVKDISGIKLQIDPLNQENNDDVLLEKWNYNKINCLFDSLLFSDNKNVDAYQFRLIVQFFMKEREEIGTNFNLEILQDYFNPEMSVEKSTEEFRRKYIKENQEERDWYLSK